MSRLAVGVAGAAGRMGQALIRAIQADPDCQLAAVWERPGHPQLGELVGGLPLGDGLEPFAIHLHVAIDFTSPDATLRHAEIAGHVGLPLIVGTTGLEAHHYAALIAAARSIPLLQASNTSVGVNVLLGLVQQAARLLGDGFDLEIVEAHHRGKRDAPSGTAISLLRALQAGRPGTGPTFARHGDIGPRATDEIGVQTLRGGDVVGEHTVFFFGQGERLELTHRATDRSIFAAGAVRAAKWLVDQPPGRYGMADVLGLS